MNAKDTQPTIEELQTKVEAYEEIIKSLQEDVEAETAQTKRAIADIENFRRRENENKASWSADAVAKFLKAFLPQFLALHLGAQQSKDEDLKATIANFVNTLAKEDVTQINPKKGTPLNPDIHEVVMTAEGDAGTIVEVFEPGWKYKDTLIAPAKVSAAPQS